MRLLRSVAAILMPVVFSIGTAAHGFSLSYPSGDSTREIFERTGRWSSISGLDDGIQVGVEPGFAADLGASGPEVDLLNQAVADAFTAWENPALQFDITFDAPAVEEDTERGFEIDVFAVPGTHPFFAGTSYLGVASVGEFLSNDRPLTNGQSFPGYAISGADIFINFDILILHADAFGLDFSERLAAGQRLVMHELGHALGLHHPNSNNPFGVATNYDTDNDPFNAMVIDPMDPFGELIVSANRDDTAIMSNRPCGDPPVGPCPALFFTSLQYDDLGGRDALYPIPEPTTALLLALGLTALAVRRTPQIG